MRRIKSTNPADRMGVYKCLNDVPDRYRLHHHATAYEGRDVWQEFCEKYEYEQAGEWDRYEEFVDRAGRKWQTHMTDRGRHHALAIPADVEAWTAILLNEYSLRYAYDNWIRVERFYGWLQWHSEHPHVYHPFLMAAADGGAAGQVWQKKAERHREHREASHRDGREKNNQ